MNPRTWLLVAATLSGWAALLLSAVTSGSTPLLAVLAGVVSLGVWHRFGRAAATAVPLGCVALLVSGTSVLVAGAVGILALAHLVLTDLAPDAYGATAGQVLDALRRMAPGAMFAAGATVVVVVAALVGSAAPAAVVAPLLLSAPLLLLAALLLALGQDTRRGFWSRIVSPRRLSALTRRYLARAESGR